MSILLVIGFANFANAQTKSENQKIVSETNVAVLQQMSEKSSEKHLQNKAKALQMAKENNWIVSKEIEGGGFMELQGVTEDGRPLYYITHNEDAAISTSTNKVYSGGGLGLDLDGTGMTAGEWDGGDVRTTHQEFNNTGSSRVTDMDGVSSTHYHATHVAGTIMAGGVQPAAKGMAYNASLDAYDWTNDESEMATAAANGLLISNHSYGYGAGWAGDGSEWYGDVSISNEEDFQFGFYSSYCVEIDNIAINAPYYLIVKSSGNDQGDWDGSSTLHPQDGGADGFDCISYKGNAKNILTVGATEDVAGGYSQPSDVTLTYFSSTGPCDDSRIKPDIVGNGYNLYSTYDGHDSEYNSISGTSMSSPNVTGSLLLLQEHYNETQGSFMKAATLKALAIHTADECGANEGPDYKFGWGLLNTATAATAITNKEVTSIINEETYTGSDYVLEVYSDGTQPLMVTIVWTDLAGTPPSASLDPTDIMLVNDLDMTITGTGGPYKPYKLTAANPSAAATTGDNDVDNVEKIYIANPTAGDYTITIDHEGSITGGSQNFSIIVTGIIANTELCPVITTLPFSEDFETTTENIPIALNCWTNYIEEGTRSWEGRIYIDNRYAQFLAYDSGEASNTSWLITPEISFDNYDNEALTFKTQTGFYVHDGLTVMISTNYDGSDPTTATWTTLPATLATDPIPATNYSGWIESGDIDLSSYTGTGYIAFKYTGSGTGGQTTIFQVDNVVIKSAITESCALALLPYTEDFENFIGGDYIANNSGIWDTWSSTPATAEDAIASTDFSSDGSKSMLITGTNDMILPLCDVTSGNYQIDFSMYIESGNGGYFNVQHELGVEWAFETYFSNNGTGYIQIAGVNYEFNYNQDSWNNIAFRINLDDDNILFTVNGTRVRSWKFSSVAPDATVGTLKLNCLNFYAGAPDTQTPKYYIDGISITEITNTVVCKEMGSSQNLYTIIRESPQQVMYNADINTLVFVHRALNLGGGDSGELAYDISTDGGNTWITENWISPTAETSLAECRYPSATIYNPNGNTNVDNAFIVSSGPSLIGYGAAAGWGYTFQNSAQLNGTNNNDSYGSINGDNTDGYNLHGLTTTPNGTAWSMSSNYNETETGDYTRFNINKGVFNSGTNKFDWSINKAITPDLFYDAGNKIATDYDIAFSPDGSVGYAVINCLENGESLQVPTPHVWKTTDNGATWTELPIINYDNFPELSGYLVQEATLKPYINNFDLTVDENNRLHIFAEVYSGSDAFENVMPIFDGSTPTVHFIDFSTQDGTEWDMLYISPKNNESYTFGDVNHDLMPEVSRKNDGSVIFYTWSETSGSTQNSNPDIMAAAVRPGGDLSSIKNLSDGTCHDNLAFFKQISPVISENGSSFDYEIPTIYTILGVNDASLTEYNYAKGLGFNDSEIPAIVTAVATIQATPTCTTGSITVNSDQNKRQTFYLLDNAGATLQTWRGVTNTHEFTNLATAIYKGKVRHMDIASSETASETLNQLDATAINTHPITQAVCEGGNVTLTVSATGTGTLAYQWKKGASNISGATSSSYSIVGVSATDAGSYTCDVIGDCGAISSNSATLTINDATVIDTHPATVTICEGENNTFTVVATGSGTLTYQWYKGASIITDETNSSYTISNITTTHIGGYTCIVTGDCGTATSNIATLTVNPATAITDESTSQTACTGSDVDFFVTATGTGLTYQWQLNGSDIANADANTFSLTNVDNGNSGTYTCNILGTCGDLTSSSMVLTITDGLTLGDPSDENVCPTETAIFTVVANGTNMTFLWKKDGSDISDGGNISGATTETISIANCDIIDEGDYTCEVTSDCGDATSNAASLDLNIETVIDVQPYDVDVCENAEATFVVEVTGTNLTYQWYFNDILILDATSETYIITGVTSDDLGNFYCEITGDCGEMLTSETVSLTIGTGITIATQPQTETICEGNDITLSIEAYGGVSYQWYFNDALITGAEDVSYTIFATTSDDLGNYYCEITGECGTLNSDEATFYFAATTVISDHPINIDATVGDNVMFSVTADGDNLTYQWKFEETDIDGADQATYQILSVTMDNAGNYSVAVTGTCGEVVSDNALLSVATSIEELTEMGINIYPNPTTGLLNIVLPENAENTEIIITDVTGKIVYQDNILEQDAKINLNVEAGVYLIRFNFNEKSVISTIIVE